MAAEGSRFRAALIASLVVHAVLVAVLGLMPSKTPQAPAAERFVKVDLAMGPTTDDRRPTTNGNRRQAPDARRQTTGVRRVTPAVPQTRPRVENRTEPFGDGATGRRGDGATGPMAMVPPTPDMPRPAPVTPREIPTPREMPTPQPVTRRVVRTAVNPSPVPSPKRGGEQNPSSSHHVPPSPFRGGGQGGGVNHPGGRLAMGQTSTAGTIPTGSSGSGGRTPVGSVPNENVGGSGSGSGDAPNGRGGGGDPTPPPTRTPDPDPPSPPRQDPPPPKKVEVRVCERSGQRVGRFCTDTRERSFLEGDAPSGKCGQCKEPEPEHVNRVAESSEPVCTRDADPEVPDSLREEGVEGSFSVTVSYTVSANGRVTDVSVSRSSGHDALDDAAVRAIRKFRYKPAQQNGQPRPFKMTKQFRFRISG